MSALPTFLRPFPAARRAYSVFTKPGGKAYFNSAKPPTQSASGKSKVETQPSSSNAETQTAGVVDEPLNAQTGAPLGNETKVPSTSAPLGINFTPYPVHPPVNPHDLKLHQFFSLHRPLLTISQPPSSIFESVGASAFPPEFDTTAHLGAANEQSEASPESDADAARQLARALVVNRVGAALSWESALEKLGMDVSTGRAEEVVQAQAEFDAYMDSTKRKRRKKMKKHK